jgi:hypothetical protein
MTDLYGGFPLPAVPGAFGQEAPDKALDPIGAYLQAVMPTLIGAAWAAVAPKEELIKRVFKTRPENSLVNQNQLPALYLWRGRSRRTREADDYLIARTQVTCLWLLWWDTPTKREQRMPFQGAFTHAAHSALARGRNPAWVVAGDTVSGAATRGSVLVQQAGLFEPLDDLETQEIDISLDPERSGTPVQYKALSLVFTIAERMFRDPSLFCVPTISTSDPDNANPGAGFPDAAALDLTVKQVDENPIEQLKPTS